MNRRRVLPTAVGAIVLFFAAMLSTASPASAANTPMYGDWPHSNNPSTINYIYIVDNTSAVWPVSDAMALWNSYFNANHMNVRFAFPYYGTCVDGNGKYLPRCFVVTEDTNNQYWDNIGTTRWSITGFDYNYNSEPTDAPVSGAHCNFRVNAIFLSTYNVITTAAYKNARENVVTHELGHALGLKHNPTPDTLMAAGGDNSTEFSNVIRTPKAADILAVNSAYLTAC
jgi:hypothetical protein